MQIGQGSTGQQASVHRFERALNLVSLVRVRRMNRIAGMNSDSVFTCLSLDLSMCK